MYSNLQLPLLSPSGAEGELVASQEFDEDDVDDEFSRSTQRKGRRLQSKRTSFSTICMTTCGLATFCVLLCIIALLIFIVRQNEAITRQSEAIALYKSEIDQLASVAINYTTATLRPGSFSTTTWSKPSEFKIIAMVFFGRPYTLDILDCYLKRNLASNGGFIDEVHFMVHPNKEEDIEWLDLQVESTPEYKKIDEDGVTKNCIVAVDGKESCELADYGDMWKHATELDTMYIKIDDDVVYIHDDAIPSLVNSLIIHPEAYLIFANSVNSAVAQWLHWHTGAIYPYLPEPIESRDDRPEWRSNKTSWRASELPLHPIDVGTLPMTFNVEDAKPPFQGHRWLPLEDTPLNLAKTPIAQGLYAPLGLGWISWAIACQQHYSLFQNLEQDTLWKYLFGDGEGLWNMQFTRNSINMIAIWGRTVAEHLPSGPPDEKQLAHEIPLLLNRPTLIDSKALVSHFHYSTQQDGILKTDLLDRYRAYANEKVCTQDNQKTSEPLDSG